MQSSFNNIRNAEVAICKKCHQKGYAVLMNYGDKFTNDKALENIAKAVQPR